MGNHNTTIVGDGNTINCIRSTRRVMACSYSSGNIDTPNEMENLDLKLTTNLNNMMALEKANNGSELQEKIKEIQIVNKGIYLSIDNTKLAADNFMLEFKKKLAIKMSVYNDITELKTVLDELTMSSSDLKMQSGGLKEQPIQQKKNRGKSESQNKEMAVSVKTVQTTNSELTDLKRMKSFEIELQSQSSMKASLESSLSEIQDRYAQLLTNYEQQEHQALLDMKTRLEKEIADYRKRLDK